MSEAKFSQLLSFFKALADKSRLKLLGILANRECSVSELADLLDLSEPTVSHHLSMLREMNLVRMRAEGNVHMYSFNEQALIDAKKEMFSADSLAALAPKTDEASWRDKVLSTFVIDGRLTQIPAQLKKQVVILRWLVEQLEPEVRYPERELNEVIKRYHPDTASLRRALVDHRFMQRESGVYWRRPMDEWPEPVRDGAE